MIQQLGNAFITMTLAKFILNDVPHALGLTSKLQIPPAYYWEVYDTITGTTSVSDAPYHSIEEARKDAARYMHFSSISLEEIRPTRLRVYEGDPRTNGRTVYEVIVRLPYMEELPELSNPWNPASNYYHGTYDYESIPNIISEGLRPGSSVSSWKGQATSYPIILEYPSLVAREVLYRPEDFTLIRTSGRPTAIYVLVEDYTRGIRPEEEINEELAKILERLETSGIATPERVGELIGDKSYRALRELDERLPYLAREMDDLITYGPRPGGERILKRVIELAGDIPVYRTERDEEGEINWSTRQKQ